MTLKGKIIRTVILMKVEVNLMGLCCSVPQLIVYSKLKKMKEGDLLDIVVEKGSSQEQDIVMVLQKFGFRTEVSEKDDCRRYLVHVGDLGEITSSFT